MIFVWSLDCCIKEKKIKNPKTAFLATPASMFNLWTWKFGKPSFLRGAYNILKPRHKFPVGADSPWQHGDALFNFLIVAWDFDIYLCGAFPMDESSSIRCIVN